MKTNALPVLKTANRTKFIGGSDCAPILGISPWRTPLEVYLDKVQPRARSIDPEKQQVLKRGKRMEPYVIDLLQEEMGLEIVRRGQRYLDPELPFIAAEIDAEAATGENIEIKTSSPFKAREWGEQQTDEIPVYYTAQAMHGLMVTGASVCLFGVLIGADDFRIYRVERDEDTIAAIRAKEQAFWQRIQDKNPPAPSTAADVLHWYGAGNAGKAVEATGDIRADVLNFKQLKDEIKHLEALASAAEERIKLYMGDASLLTDQGKLLASWKAQSFTRLDQQALKREQAPLYAQYQRVSETRVFRLK